MDTDKNNNISGVKFTNAPWLKVNFDENSIKSTEGLVERLHLNTVCREAGCPNMGECYKNKTATFMVLGKNCSRNCLYCNVGHGKPEAVDASEPENLALAVKALGLHHIVITQPTRDDLPDGGAAHLCACLERLKEMCPELTTELLISDLGGNLSALESILDAGPIVLNHNIETVKRLFPVVRPQGNYEVSLSILKHVKDYSPSTITKSGFMAGLGETKEEVSELMDDLLENGCEILTIGQYLRPSKAHYPVKKYLKPHEFDAYREMALKKGFKYCSSSALVRSSYRAGEALIAAGFTDGGGKSQ